MSLNDWLSWGWVTEHKASREEIADLLAVADRDLQQSQTEGLGPDWRLAIAYNAALQYATAALAAAGYRAVREAHHYRVIQSLELTVGWGLEEVRALDTYRTKRHAAGYQRPGLVSERDAQEILRLAQKLRGDVAAWLRAEHPELLPG
jgi:hypothetical protein